MYFFPEDEHYEKFCGDSVKFIVKKPEVYESEARKELRLIYAMVGKKMEVAKKN